MKILCDVLAILGVIIVTAFFLIGITYVPLEDKEVVRAVKQCTSQNKNYRLIGFASRIVFDVECVEKERGK